MIGFEGGATAIKWMRQWTSASCLLLALLLLAACGATPGPLPLTASQGTARTADEPDPAAGAMTLLLEGGDSASLNDDNLIEVGRTLYTSNCAPCHQPNGEGLPPTFPALNRNPFVTVSDPTAVIDAVLHGRQVMPAFEPTLSPQEVAAVISYIRNAWNNEAPVVDIEQVREVQEEASTQ